MQYAILIYYDEKVHAQMNTEENDTLMKANDAFVARYSDKILTTVALRDVETSTTVRVRDGRTLTISGPFAETTEQLGGLCVVECDNLDEAIELSALIPDAVHGSIEVRPVWGYHTS